MHQQEMTPHPAGQGERFAPFALDDDSDYCIWRERKLALCPDRVEELLVEVEDPSALSAAEHAALLERCRRANMALYAGRKPHAMAKQDIKSLGRRFGLSRLDHNWLADDDAVTSLTVNPEGAHPEFIPYTNRPIHWHTDGYYNPPDRQVRGLMLHCAQPAAQGGENALADHEMVYIYLRDRDPAFIRALMAPDAMTIPARSEDGVVVRPAQSGPVFSIDTRSGDLHMRYTARTRNVLWKDDPVLHAALDYLARLLAGELPCLFHARLEAGMGLISNNVLHDRSGFQDAPGAPQRLLYRARYYDRIDGTGL